MIETLYAQGRNVCDAGAFKQDAQEALRFRAIRLVVREGKSPAVVYEGVLGGWVWIYRREGTEAMQKKKRGQRIGNV